MGPIFASIIGSAVGTLVNGGTWKSFAIGVGIGLAAGMIASGIGSSFDGGDFFSGAADYFSNTGGALAQWAGEGIAQAFAAGALTGAIAGGLSSAVYGTNVGQGMLEGMAGGVIGTAVGMATTTVLEAGKGFIQGIGATVEVIPVEGVAITACELGDSPAEDNIVADPNMVNNPKIPSLVEIYDELFYLIYEIQLWNFKQFLYGVPPIPIISDCDDHAIWLMNHTEKMNLKYWYVTVDARQKQTDGGGKHTINVIKIKPYLQTHYEHLYKIQIGVDVWRPWYPNLNFGRIQVFPYKDFLDQFPHQQKDRLPW